MNVDTKGMSCPHCETELTPEEIKRLWAMHTRSLRKTQGGAERVQRACPRCGLKCDTARGAWSHCRIPRGLGKAFLLGYVVGRMPKELADLRNRRFGSLEALQDVVAALGGQELKPAAKRQVKWYLSYIDRAMEKVEDAA